MQDCETLVQLRLRPSTLTFGDFVQTPHAVSNSLVLLGPSKLCFPAQFLMSSLIYFRFRNCVYTYRILPNEDDEFTVQVSPNQLVPSLGESEKEEEEQVARGASV